MTTRDRNLLVEYGPPNLLLQQTGNVREIRDIDAFLRTLRDATDAIFGQKWQVALSDRPADRPALDEFVASINECGPSKELSTDSVPAIDAGGLDRYPRSTGLHTGRRGL